MMNRIPFKSLLSDATGITPFGYKEAQSLLAEDGTSGEDQMEVDFARLAYTFLQDRAPQLMPYILGFEVVNKAEDGSRAVGIFGFKVGKDYIYVPTFFINNQIKGMDMLFNKRTNTLMPLIGDVLDDLVNKQNIELGNPSTDPVDDFESPDFSFARHPPVGVGLKYGSDTNKSRLRRAWDDIRDSVVDSLEKDAEFQNAWAGFVCAYTGEALPFEKTAEGSPLIRFMSAAGPVASSAFLNTLTSDIKYANAALTFYPDVESVYVHEFDPEVMRKTAAEIVIVTQAVEWINGEERKRLVRDGFTIVDRRKPEHVSESLPYDATMTYQNPTTPGKYDVLLAGGECAKADVFMPAPVLGNDIVIHFDDGDVRLAEPRAIFVRSGVEEDDNKFDAYDKAIALSDMEIGETYILVNADGKATVPLQIKGAVSQDGERTEIRATHRWYSKDVANISPMDFDGLYMDDPYRNVDGILRNSVWGPNAHNDGGPDYVDYVKLQLADHNGTITEVSGKCVIPANWKAIRTDKETNDQSAYDSNIDKILGGLADVSIAMAKTAEHKVTVASDDGVEYYFRLDDNPCSTPRTYKWAFADLVGKFGLPVGEAEIMLKEARDTYKSRRLVRFKKTAQYYADPSAMIGVPPMGSAGVDVAMPHPAEQIPGMDPYSGVPVMQMTDEQMLHGDLTGMPPLPYENQPGINIGGDIAIDQGAADLAAQAAEAGQKTVFDHASLGGLAKVYDTGTVIDSFIPDFTQTLDKLGRVLFLFYWKNDDFIERYGSNDIAGMEDLMKSVFKGFGELTTQLKQRAVDSEDASSIDM